MPSPSPTCTPRPASPPGTAAPHSPPASPPPVPPQTVNTPHLPRAADPYDRAARPPYGHLPKKPPAGEGLRTAARLLALAGLIGDKPTVAILPLVTNLIALMETVAHLHDA